MKRFLISTIITLSTIGLGLYSGIVNAQTKVGFGSTTYVEKIGVPGTEKTQDDALIITIQTAVNRILGMLSFVALILCLWAGFQMMTSGGDSKKYSTGFSILKNAAIGLAIIATSRLIVSLIFWFINGSTQGVDGGVTIPDEIH